MIPRPEPATCCEHAYICPSSGDDECLTHGGFDNCCAHPDCPGNVRYKGLAGDLRLVRDTVLDLWDDLNTAIDRAIHQAIVSLLRKLL